MYRIITATVLLFSLLSVGAYRNLPSPVNVGDRARPDSSAAFQVTSTTKGFLGPKMTTAQRDAIVSPAVGLLIYNTDELAYQTFGGAVWSSIGGGGADHPLWVTGTDYEIGSVVIDGSNFKVYRANTGHTSGASLIADIANWDELSDDLNRELSATDNALVVWDGAGGDDVKNSALIVSGASSENLTTVGDIEADTIIGTTDIQTGNVTISGNTVESTNATGDLLLDTNGGQVRVLDDLIAEGNFTVNGTTTTINSATLEVADQQIVVNKGGNQASADSNDAGLRVEMSDATDAGIFYDSTFTSLMGVGPFNDFREIVTVDHAQDITAKTLLEVDNLRLNGNTLTSTDTNGNTILDANGSGLVQIDQNAQFIGANMHFKPSSGVDGVSLRPSSSALSLYREDINFQLMNFNLNQTNAYTKWRFLVNESTKTIPTVALGSTVTGINYESSGTQGLYLIANSVNSLNVFENEVDVPTLPFRVGEITLGETSNQIESKTGDLTIASADEVLIPENVKANYVMAGDSAAITAIEPSAALEVKSTTKGSIACPKMTKAQRDAVASPVEGLCVYNTDANQTQIYNGVSWSAVSGMALESTGLLTGGVMSTGGACSVANTCITITDGAGFVVDSHTDPTNAVVTPVAWSGLINIDITDIGLHAFTAIGINSSGSVVQKKDSIFTAEEERDYILLGNVLHSGGTITRYVNRKNHIFGGKHNLNDLARAIGLINISGNIYSANSNNLTISRSAGDIFEMGAGVVSNAKDPNTISNTSEAPTTFIRLYSAGNNGVAETNIDPTQYDNAGTLSSVGNNEWTVQRIYFGPVSPTDIVMYGQAKYSTPSEAIESIATENFVVSETIKRTSLLRGFLVLKGNATDLSDTGQAIFIEADKFGQSTAGGAGTSVSTTMQASYDNSTQPQIVLDSTRNGIQIRDASTPIGVSLLAVQDNAGATNYFNVLASHASFTQGLVVGGSTLTANTAFEVASTSKASIPAPKMTEAQRDAVASPVEGMQVFNTTTGKLNIYSNGSWIPVGSGSGGGLDSFYTETFEEGTDETDFSCGNNATFLGGGTVDGTPDIEVVTVIKGSKTFEFTAGATAANTEDDYCASPIISLDPKEGDGGKTVGLNFWYTYSGADDEVTVVVYDDTNDTVVSSSLDLLKSGTDPQRYSTSVNIPDGVSQIRWGFHFKTTPASANNILRIDDVEFTLDPFSYKDIISKGSYRANGHAGYGSTNTKIPYFSSITINTLDKFGTISNDSTNGWSFTANQNCTVAVSYIGSSGAATDQYGLSLNSNQLTTNVFNITQAHRIAYDIPASVGEVFHVTRTIELSAGDVLRPHTSGATPSIVEFGIDAFSTSEHVVTPSESAVTTTKILSANVNTQTDMSDLTFTGLVIGHKYLLTGVLDIASFDNQQTTIQYWSGAGGTGTLYGKNEMHIGTGPSFGRSAFSVSVEFTAESTTLYARQAAASPKTVYGDGTRGQTFLQLTNVTRQFLAAVPVEQIAYLSDVKTIGTDGGSASANTVHTRDLNTIEGDSHIVSLSSNQFTLQRGKYAINAVAPSFKVQDNKAYIWSSARGYLLIGTSVYSDPATGNTGVIAPVNGLVEVSASSETFELRHYTNTANGTTGLGTAVNDTVANTSEVYSKVEIRKLR